MWGKSTHVVILRASAIFLLLVITLTHAAQDHDVPVSVDGIRCDSCGSECSMHCGSRTFRACCYNYIKKRSIPWQSSGGGSTTSGDTSEDESHQETAKTSSGPVSEMKVGSAGSSSNTGGIKSPLLTQHQNGGLGGKHIFQRYVPDLASGTDSLEGTEYLYPLTVRELVTNIVRTLNAYEAKKFGRDLVF